MSLVFERPEVWTSGQLLGAPFIQTITGRPSPQATQESEDGTPRRHPRHPPGVYDRAHRVVVRLRRRVLLWLLAQRYPILSTVATVYVKIPHPSNS